MAKRGRLSYKEAYCDEAIEFLTKGHSIAALAGHFGVHRGTIYDWIKQFPDFAEAMKIAAAKSVLFWECRAIDAANGGKGIPAIIIFGLKNRAPEEWRDVQNLQHTGADGGPIETKDVSARDRLLDLVNRAAESEREDEDNKRTTH